MKFYRTGLKFLLPKMTLSLLWVLVMTSPTYAADKKLTQEDAELRFKQIKQVDYDLYFKLPESSPSYSGKVVAHLDVNPNAAQISQSIFLDFDGGELQSVVLNGHSAVYQYDGARILIPASAFKSGVNSLEIQFTHVYGNEGVGFHRTRDKADGKYYMYSQFEPYSANKAFPLLDQPDLKATFTLTTDAPAQWQVISNCSEISRKSLSETEDQWIFPTSQRFSSYLFALVAGPFVKWESATTTEKPIPLRLFARESMKQYLQADVDHWFHVTDLGFLFFEKAFGYPYPFGKYDQILVPDYNMGAMENVGAVTFTESYIFRTPPTPIKVLGRAETILHELAHMWFGNLVTMKWWDDLWLNESFATYISNYAMSHFEDKISTARVWQEFNTQAKEWAYDEDSLVTTHPIAGVAVDTDEAESNFDGLTYGKGASVLKQLVHLIGEESFLTGLKSYFKMYAFRNATRADFLQSLSLASGKDLSAWDEEWLRTSGTNAVEAVVEEKDGKISRLVLKQSPDEASQRLRTHKTQVALFDRDSQGGLVLRETLNVSYAGRETVIREAVGKLAPAFVYPNDQDHDYVSVVIDPKSLALLSDPTASIHDPLLTQMLGSSLWGMVRHSKLPAQSFAKIMFSILNRNQDLAVLQSGLEQLQEVSDYYIGRSIQASYNQGLEAWVEKYFDRVDGADPAKILLFSAFLSIAQSPAAQARVRTWLNQAELAPQFKMDQERRWAVISFLAKHGAPEAPELIRIEAKKDANDKGQLSALVAEVLSPNEDQKKIWWNRILGKDPSFRELSIQDVRRVMIAFHHLNRPELTAFSTDAFFEVLPILKNEHSHEFTTSFARRMFPIAYSQELDDRVGSFLTTNPLLEFGAKKEILNNRQIMQRVRSAQAVSEAAVSENSY